MVNSAAMQMLGVLFLLGVLLRTTQAQTDEDLRRPYSFAFDIEDMQHRQEQKDEQGIITGEYGFFTSDGWYQTTVYATDKDGRFIIVEKKRRFIGPDPFAANRRAELPKPTPAPVTTVPTPRPFTTITPTTYKPPLSTSSIFKGIPACGSCIVPTTQPPSALSGSKAGVPPPSRQPGVNTFNDNNRPGGNLGSISPGSQGTLKPSGFKPNNGPFGDNISRPPTNNFRPVNPSTPTRVNSDYPSQPVSRPIVVPDHPSTFQNNENLQGNGGPNYRFKYILGFHGHQETGYRDGSKMGDYFVNTRDGTGHKITYEANEFGYQPKVTQVKLSPNATPRKDTEQQEDGLKEYEFVWFKR